jgi:hypothetical protein
MAEKRYQNQFEWGGHQNNSKDIYPGSIFWMI